MPGSVGLGRGPILVRTEEDRHWWFAGRTGAIFAALDPLAPGQTLSVLDVGCGAGNMIHHLARYGQVTGIDNFEKPLAVARQRGYDVRLASATEMPFDAGSFDLVAALDVVEHCEDDRRVLSECRRVCRDGGLVVITTPAFQGLWSYNDEVNGHVRRYSAGDLRAKVEAAGFRVRRLTYNNFFVFPLAAGLILLRRGAQQRPQLAAPVVDEEAYQVEMEPTSPPVNSALTLVGRIEAGLIGRVGLPIGTGLICVGQAISPSTQQ